jgi:uncharacterized protein YkwD
MRTCTTWWLRLLALAGLLLVLAAPGSAQAATLGCADNSAGTTDLAAWIPEMLAATNAHRATVGAPALQLDPSLTIAATWKSRDLAQRNYFAHDDQAGSDGSPSRTPWERLVACGGSNLGTRGENIAAGQQSGAAFIEAWLNSPGHRANIENATFRYVGFGVASSTTSTYGTYATQMFSSVAGPITTMPTTTTPTTPTTDTSGGGDTTGNGTRDPLEATTDLAMRAGASVTRTRCRSRFAVAGWCWYVTARGTLTSSSSEAIAARSVVATRRLASGRWVALGTVTSSADGAFVVRRLVRPPAVGTITWLQRNARTIGLSVAQSGSLPATYAGVVARVRV